MKNYKLDVILLAAGYSTRLYPLTRNFPKPLLEVAGKPIITNIIEKLENLEEIKNVYVVTNNRYYSHFIKWNEKLKTKLKIEIINDGTLHEQDKMGALGDIYFTINKKLIKGPLMIIGGDNLFDFQLSNIVSFFKEKNKDVVSVCKIEDQNRLRQLGVVKLDEKNKIIFFKEKPEIPLSNFVVNCMYIYTHDTVKRLKEYIEQKNNPDQTGRFVEWLYTRKEIYGFHNKGRIIDVGTTESLEEARKEFTFS